MQQLSTARARTYNRRVKPPPITVTCDCGERASLVWGERWTCPTCGRKWNTRDIPEDEYRRLEQVVRRYQIQAVAFIALIAAVFVPLMVIIDVRFSISALILFFAWALLVRPRQRRRVLEIARENARWELHPE